MKCFVDSWPNAWPRLDWNNDRSSINFEGAVYGVVELLPDVAFLRHPWEHSHSIGVSEAYWSSDQVEGISKMPSFQILHLPNGNFYNRVWSKKNDEWQFSGRTWQLRGHDQKHSHPRQDGSFVDGSEESFQRVRGCPRLPPHIPPNSDIVWIYSVAMQPEFRWERLYLEWNALGPGCVVFSSGRMRCILRALVVSHRCPLGNGAIFDPEGSHGGMTWNTFQDGLHDGWR